MKELTDHEILVDLRRFIQAGFLATVVVLEQVRDGKQGSPSPDDIENAAALLRQASHSLGD